MGRHIRFEAARLDDAALTGYLALLQKCFPASAQFSLSYLDWLYRRNPDGRAIGFDAWDGEVLAAHYRCIPTQLRVSGQLVNAMLSLNTATHPDYRGLGLFTRLAQLTYEAAHAIGISCVYGVANANSTHGFVNKLGFQMVCALEARVGFGGLNIDWHRVEERSQFAKHWTASNLAWRCANPRNQISHRTNGDLVQFHSTGKSLHIAAYSELPTFRAPVTTETLKGEAPALRLFLGLVPENCCNMRHYAAIPQWMRPSPLNLIYRSLNRTVSQLDARTVEFSFMDFDAY